MKNPGQAGVAEDILIASIGDRALQPRWHVIHTHRGKERYVEISLNHNGVSTFLPVIGHDRKRKSVRHEADLLFPQYLFAMFDASLGWRTVTYTSGVDTIVSFGGVPATVDESVIDALRRETALYEHEPRVGFCRGDEVRFISGPFKELYGVVERRSSSRQRVRVLLSYLSRQVPVEVPAGALEVVKP